VGRPCGVCTHPARGAIDKALAAGEPIARIAARHGLSEDAVSRHNAEHLPARLARAAEREEVRQAFDAWTQLRAVNAATLAILKEAREARDHDVALKAIARVEKQIELQARLLGELDDRPQVNLLVAPEWLSVRAALLAALMPYPEARLAVAGSLARLEGGS
jgi:hypothetical protein